MQKNQIITIFLILLALSLAAVPVSAEMATASGSSGVSRGDYNTLAIYEAKETYKKSDGAQYVTPWAGIIPGSNSGCGGSRYLAYRYRLLAPDGTNYDQIVYKNSFDAGNGLWLSANDFFFTDSKAIKWLKVSNLINDAERNGFAWEGTWTMEYYFGDYDCKKYEYTAYRPTSKQTFTLVDDSVAATTTATQRPVTATPTTSLQYVTTTTTLSAPAGSFTGDWATSYGPMFLVQAGSEVTGTYEYGGSVSTIEGTMSGNILSGTWREPGKSGEFRFILTPDGNSFSGDWKNSGSTSWTGTWSGKRTTISVTQTRTASPTVTRTPNPITPQRPVVTATISSLTSCPGSGTTIYVEDRKMEKGSTVKIPVMICNARDIANMDLMVSYDTSVLKFQSAEKGGLNANSLFESNEATPGTIRISFASSSGNTGSGSIAFLTFTVIGPDGSASPIRVEVKTASSSTGTTVPVTVSLGTFTVGTTDMRTFDGGPVTARDALAALQMSVGKIPTDLKYDVTSDGSVNSSDARAILKLAVGSK